MAPRRRGQGEGSMRQRSPGVWQFRMRVGPDPMTGAYRIATETWPSQQQRRSPGFVASKKAASDAFDAWRVKLRKDGPAVAGTLGELLDAWMKVAPISRTSVDTYRSALKHLPPAWRDRKATSIRAIDISTLYRALVSQHGVGAQTVRKLHTVLSGAFTQGIQWELLVRNPCTKAKLPAVTSTTRIPTDDELAALFDQATEQERVLLATAIAAGGRRGEMVALRWSHLDLTGGRIRIVESRTVHGETKDTKTGSDDYLPLAPDVVAQLAAWRIAQIERALRTGVPYAIDGYVLSDVDDAGKPWRAGLASTRFDALRRRAGVTGVRLHDLRHTTATHLLNEGVPITVVSKHMRHSRVSTTLDVYGKVIAGHDQQTAAVLGAIVKKASGGPAAAAP